jgi:hypothetical protein
MYTNDRRRGAALGLSIVLAFFLLAMLLGLFWLSMYFGGSREAKTAGDAGALNVGKQTATFQVALQPGDELTNFVDVTNNGDSQVSLTNINRVWAKAMLVAINGAQMQTDGTIASAETDVQQMQSDASAISGRLATALSDPTNLTNFYLAFAQQNSTRMLGTGSEVQVGDDLMMDWSTSFLDQPAGGSPAGTPYESNIQIDPSSQFPPGFDASQIKTVNPKNDSSHTYLAGYLPYNVMNLNFWQVPFRFGERPHLVAKSEFTQYADASKLGPPSWTPNAVPNAFATLGATANNRQYSALAAAWVQTNPQKTWQAAIPDGYVRIMIHSNKLVWTIAGSCTPPYLQETDSYDFYPGQDVTPDFSTLPVIACASVTPEGIVGDEYLLPTLFSVLYALPPIPPMSCQSFTAMLQRVDQIHPGTSSSDLIGLLSAMPIDPTGGDQEFVIYNLNPTDYTSKLIITPLSASPPTVQGSPDGSQQTMESEGPVGPFFPDFCWETITCDTSPWLPGLAMISATRTWTPGTGYSSTTGQGGCLGKLEVQRETDLDFAVPPCACDL